MAHDPFDLGAGLLEFLTERHLATLTTLRPDGSPHVVPVGVTYDPGTRIARVITSGGSAKARHVRDGRPRVAVCQVDGRRWLTLEGPATVTTEAGRCRDAERRYAERYREPKQRADRAVIEIAVDRVLGRG